MPVSGKEKKGEWGEEREKVLKAVVVEITKEGRKGLRRRDLHWIWRRWARPGWRCPSWCSTGFSKKKRKGERERGRERKRKVPLD